jgi:hypothetical protein
VSEYWSLEDFRYLYLEDSWVTDIEAHTGILTLHADLVLREEHPLYRAPEPGEQYCYQAGRIVFPAVERLSWEGQGRPPAVDESGERDYGGIDSFEVDPPRYRLSGDFGRLVVDSQPPEVRWSV